ncbi:MAG: hypothetical protein E7479_02255 [Ruminococcaceae bacterium]|nr:hypothetical protein [Oscillospiraceae bacterium]
MTTEELYDNISRGGEIEFNYNNKHYSITHIEQGIIVMEAYNDDSEQIYSQSEEVGEYIIQGKKLKDILDEIIITFRCF